jgi:hypothetical protein
MQQAEFEEHIGAQNICPNIRAGIERAQRLFLDGHAMHRTA